jgi:O-antigen ligase
VLIIVSWAKAGLAGDWILYIVDFSVFWMLIFSLKGKWAKKHMFPLGLPIFILIIVFIISYFNPAYRILNDDEWIKLNIQESLNKEVNISKVQMTVKAFDNIYKVSKQDPELSVALFFHFKNNYYDSFNKENSSIDKFIIKYQNNIKLNKNDYLPTLPLKNTKVVIDFTHFIFQILLGFVVFLNLKDIKEIRKIIFIFCLNGFFLAFFGIIQKLNYVPSVNLKEIWGIWNAPEPRYYFASFTYKNHWAIFAIMTIFMATSLLIHEHSRDTHNFLKKLKVYFLIFSIILLLYSIILSGSRSGLLLIFIVIIFLIIITIFNIFKNNKRYLFISTLLIFLGTSIITWVSFNLHKQTTSEMVNNTKIQLDSISSGDYPLRVMLWKDLLNQIMQNPLLGYGYNSFKSLNPKFQSKTVREKRNIVLENAHHDFTPLFGYGHNDWLEKITEFGLIGTLPFCYYLYLIFSCLIKSKSKTSKILICGSLLFLLYSFVDFPSRTPCCLLSFSLLTGLALKYNYLVHKNYL